MAAGTRFSTRCCTPLLTRSMLRHSTASRSASQSPLPYTLLLVAKLLSSRTTDGLLTLLLLQRGHQNSLEGFPLHVALTFVVGIKVCPHKTSKQLRVSYLKCAGACKQQIYSTHMQRYCLSKKLLNLSSCLQFPVFAFLTGATYTVGRILYFKGYSTGDPKNRFRGAFYNFANLAQLLAVIYVGVLFLLGK